MGRQHLKRESSRSCWSKQCPLPTSTPPPAFSSALLVWLLGVLNAFALSLGRVGGRIAPSSPAAVHMVILVPDRHITQSWGEAREPRKDAFLQQLTGHLGLDLEKSQDGDLAG